MRGYDKGFYGISSRSFASSSIAAILGIDGIILAKIFKQYLYYIWNLIIALKN